MRRAAAVALIGSVAALAVSPALAEPKDAQAQKALREALDSDYLETRFDKAEQKLRAAIEACGANGCSAPVKAKLYAALGAVLAGGKKQLEDARDAFVEALKLDKNVKPDPDVASAEVNFAFEKALAALKIPPAGGSAPPPSGEAEPESGIGVMVSPAQKLATPVPIYVELSPDLAPKTKKVTVTYKGPGRPDWKSLVMKPFGDRGYAMNVPCADLDREGVLAYVIVATDAGGGIVAAAGTRDKPITTEIQAGFAGEPPHLPNHEPPATCGVVEAGPSQCLDDRQCNAGLVCIQGRCQPRPAGGATGRNNWVSLSFAPDVSIVSGSDVCTNDSQSNDHFVCYRDDGSRYVGTPTKGVADNVRTGPALATLRVMVGYDRVLFDRITLGARVGFAFGGATTEGASFLPIHLEARGAYYLLKRPFDDIGVRPYVFISGGLAQVDTKVDVDVLEDGKVCGAAIPSDRKSKCTVPSRDGHLEPRIQTLHAYKQAGNAFVGAGVGLGYAPTPMIALNAALRGQLTFPVLIPVIVPELGVALGF